MNENVESISESARSRRRRTGRSMFGPVILIAIGLALLLDNLGQLPEVHWVAALRLWPLLLIFGGINVIVRQAPRPAGTFLSLLIALAAAVTFAVALFYPERLPYADELTNESAIGLAKERVSFPLEGVRSAQITINTGSAGAMLEALQDSPELFDGDISHRGRIHFAQALNDGRAELALSVEDRSRSVEWWDPASWIEFGTANAWQLGLSRSTPLDLRLDLGSGPVDLDLSDLDLQQLSINGGSGSLDLTLPAGDFETRMKLGSGRTTIVLPEDGQHEVDISSGSGSVALIWPDTMAGRLVVEDGQSRLDMDDSRFGRVESGEDRAVWETPDFAEATERITLMLDLGSGRVTVE